MAAASYSAVDFRSEGPRDGTLKLIIAGRLDAETTGTIWRRAVSNVKAANTTNVVVDASGIEYCDGAGIALLPVVFFTRIPPKIALGLDQFAWAHNVAVNEAKRRHPTQFGCAWTWGQ